MRFLYGLVLAGGLTLAAASPAHAQLGVTLGNRYYGVGNGTVGVYPATPYYGTGYGYGFGSNYAVPGVTTYSSGYRGFAATPGYTYSPYAPYYGARTYPYRSGYGQPIYRYGRRSGGLPVFGRWGGGRR